MNLLPYFAAGLAASVHCVGMCGGIAGALGGAAGPAGRATPATLHPRMGPAASASAQPAAGTLAPHPASALVATLPRVLRIAAFNTGRIASYMAAGAAAGGLAGGTAGLAAIGPLQKSALLLANLMLLAIGLYLMDAWRGLAHVERAGAWLWRSLQPMLRAALPITSPAKALAAGALWGWLPCGLVYSMLVTAMLSGSSINGAAVMLAFGLGNTPLLFATGMSGMALRGFLQRRNVRIACAVLVMTFAVLGLLRVAGTAIPGVPALHGWAETMCIGGAR
jgi:sulfite exporter TauE/SafE